MYSFSPVSTWLFFLFFISFPSSLLPSPFHVSVCLFCTNGSAFAVLTSRFCLLRLFFYCSFSFFVCVCVRVSRCVSACLRSPSPLRLHQWAARDATPFPPFPNHLQNKVLFFFAPLLFSPFSMCCRCFLFSSFESFCLFLHL